jgi:hypothetical protein
VLVKKIILFVILSFTSYVSVAQIIPTTTIVVIGNVHDSVPNYHPQILLHILENIQPDLILHEIDAASAKEYFSKEGDENEIKASTKYIRQHANTQRATFDFEGRNSYRREKGMVPADYLSIRLIDRLYKGNMLSAEEQAAYEGYKNYTDKLIKIASGSPESFNNAVTDSICELRQHAQHYGLVKITNARREFTTHFVTRPNGRKISYRDGYRLWARFWDIRNKAMAQNILKHASNHKGETIVVLTGFFHRYYLLKELKRNMPKNVIIKEYYQ